MTQRHILCCPFLCVGLKLNDLLKKQPQPYLYLNQESKKSDSDAAELP